MHASILRFWTAKPVASLVAGVIEERSPGGLGAAHGPSRLRLCDRLADGHSGGYLAYSLGAAASCRGGVRETRKRRSPHGFSGLVRAGGRFVPSLPPASRSGKQVNPRMGGRLTQLVGIEGTPGCKLLGALGGKLRKMPSGARQAGGGLAKGQPGQRGEGDAALYGCPRAVLDRRQL